MEPPAREALGRARESAMHLEMRDAYAPDDPGFAAWQEGWRPDHGDRSSWWGGWHEAVRRAVDRGVRVRRARIVSEPVSDYVRYEHALTFANVAAGEEVRWLARRKAARLELPGADFWLFDGSLVLFHHFTGDGRLDRDGREHTRDPAAAALCGRAFEAVWGSAVSHSVYEIL